MQRTTTCTIGYPRTGANRELKAALERHWKGQLSVDDLQHTAADVEAAAWRTQQDAGVSLIGADGTLYDHVLDTTFWLGVIPKRFQGLAGHALYFALARGTEDAAALDMSKHFDTNYHHLVPELEHGWTVSPDYSQVLDKLRRCQAVVGKDHAVPMLVGPITWCCLAKRPEGQTVQEVVDKLLPAYSGLLRKFKEAGAAEVQLHEPWLTTTHGATLAAETRSAYAALAAVGLDINLVAPYDDLGDAYPWVITLPVAAISLDFVGVAGAATPNRSLELVKTHGFPADKRLGAGVVDGRSVWSDTGLAAAILTELCDLGVSHISVQPSVSLQHLPVDVACEVGGRLPAEVLGRLGFAKQKVEEVVRIAKQLETGTLPQASLASFTPSELPFTVESSWFHRPVPYTDRRDQQIQLPAFPTSTIGSFPQTAEVRRLRLHYKQGRISREQYQQGIAGIIGYAVGVQEALGLDVLVHGEAERTDMVEFFGQSLEGMAFTEHGWVQSYGSRYVRPPLVVGDVKFTQAMTVTEFKLAQSLTTKPMKGMLTGPVTILNWSFPRRDITRKAQAFQLALALREEVRALEEAGCKVVQVDEPALREGLPLKQERWAHYLEWAVEAFRLSCGVAGPSTQVVTHLCYSDFQDIMEAIADMDADVLTIESSRSGDEMVRALADAQYPRDLGAGVYDVHSPVVPPVEFIKDKLRSFIATGLLGGRADRIWVNPDCGLKTRGWEETLPALRNMVQAAREMRAELEADGVAGVTTRVAGKAGAEQPAGRSCVGCCH